MRILCVKYRVRTSPQEKVHRISQYHMHSSHRLNCVCWQCGIRAITIELLADRPTWQMCSCTESLLGLTTTSKRRLNLNGASGLALNPPSHDYLLLHTWKHQRETKIHTHTHKYTNVFFRNFPQLTSWTAHDHWIPRCRMYINSHSDHPISISRRHNKQLRKQDEALHPARVWNLVCPHWR